ncbi:MAG: DNA replication and repair protein RecF, partial [Candidatus Saccharibacteria bacterium]|nr:DNA replication and repair protein RecF [Candidatus Saccharibacteria bacterium]
KKISLVNFRNHETYSLACEPETTLILGSNGSGKTSVLEAIYILMRGKSFRATDPEIIKRETPFYRIEIEYETGEKVIATYDGTIKTFHVLDKKSRRLPKKSKHPVVLFEPKDLNLISGSPSRHREYFDRFFSQLNEEYSTTLSRYEKALKQRNELLKSKNVSPASLFSWNLLLAKLGSSLCRFREGFTKEINQDLNKVYYSIAENTDEIKLNYLSEAKNLSENDYFNKLEQNFEKDTYLGHTSFGVHRDDFQFIFNNHLADGSASRGETRSIILALKFVEAKTLFKNLNRKPLVLLDDVFSELDETRRKCLIKNFKDHQVIITSVEDI